MSKDVFSIVICDKLVERIEQLTVDSTPVWGVMSVGQMLAHCCVTYEMVYTDKYKKPGLLKRGFLKLFIKPFVISEKPYSKSGKTAAQFIIDEEKDFETEKKRLIHFVIKTQKLGKVYFEGKENLSFGSLTSTEWSILFYKHLDHHLQQFNV